MLQHTDCVTGSVSRDAYKYCIHGHESNFCQQVFFFGKTLSILRFCVLVDLTVVILC